MVRIALDAGHGINTPGKRTPDDEREWIFNTKVLLACAAALSWYENVEILRLDDSSGATDIPLKTRTDRANAWKADVLVSIHHNAHTGKWGSHGGVETYVQPTASDASRAIAALIHPRIVGAMGLRDRGLKTKDLHMTRESKMPAVLTEGGFMDSTTDIVALRSDDKLRVQGEAIAKALVVYFGLKPKTVASTNPPVKGGGELKFTSGTLKKEFETFLNSKAQREIAVREAVKQGYNEKWIKDLAEGKAADGDIVALGLGALVRANKQTLPK